VSHALSHGDRRVRSDGSGGSMVVSSLEDSVHSSQDSSGTSNELSVSSHDGVIVSTGEAMFLHNIEHSANSSLVVDSGVVYHSMEAVDKLHVSNQLVHVTLLEVDMTF